MFNKKNHVGRPSNKEIKIRKIKKIAVPTLITLVILFILFFVITIKNSNIQINSFNIQDDSEVKITFKPENEETKLQVNRKYRLNVDFNKKDKNKDYYYVWRKQL